MSIQEWINQEKTNTPNLSDYLTNIEPYITNTGFNAVLFERRVDNGIRKAESDIEEELKPIPNAHN